MTPGRSSPGRPDRNHSLLEAALQATIACEPIEKKLREANKAGVTDSRKALSADEFAQWERKEALRKRVIQVDDFPQDFGRSEMQKEEEHLSMKAA